MATQAQMDRLVGKALFDAEFRELLITDPEMAARKLRYRLDGSQARPGRYQGAGIARVFLAWRRWPKWRDCSCRRLAACEGHAYHCTDYKVKAPPGVARRNAFSRWGN